MIWAIHVTCMDEMSNAYKILFGNLKERDHSEELGIDGKIILDWIIRK
jgi:hypothetical protein